MLKRGVPSTPKSVWILVGLLIAFGLSGCGGGEQDGDGSKSPSAMDNRTSARETREATVRWGDKALKFSGRFCFLTEDGGSQGGVDVSDWTTSDGDELSLDWAGDSPTYAMTSIELADGREFRAVALEPGEPPLDVTISGSTATIRTNLREMMVAGAEPMPATIEVRCP